jgi:hypothetical protein
VTVDRCGYFHRSIHDLGQVRECSAFVDREMPYLFVKSAWVFAKAEDGSVTFKDPGKDDKDGGSCG